MKNKPLNLVMIILFTSTLVHAHGLSIGSGTTFSLGSATLSLSGDWTNAGTFTAGTGTVTFDNVSENQNIANTSGETFNHVTVNKTAGHVQLTNNVTINGTLTLTSGDVDLNSHIITLGSSGTLSETSGNTIKGTSGYITCTSDLNAPSGVNPHGIGVTLTSAANLGSTTIIRGHTAQSGGGNTGIQRYFTITPTNNESLNATVAFTYDESELNGIVESKLKPFRSEDSGATWALIEGSALNETSNTVSVIGIASLSRFTLGSEDAPLTGGSSIIRLQAKIFLEGPYDDAANEMSIALNGSIPTTSPYSEDARTIASIPANITDWVLVQLRSTADGAAVVSKSALLHKDGRIVADNGTTEYINLTVAAGNYFIVIKHRNHLAVESNTAHALSVGSSTLYDFTIDASTPYDKYYGGEAALLESGIYGMFSGDGNQSCILTNSDKDCIITNLNESGYYEADTNCSGIVTNSDKDSIINNLNKATHVNE